MSLREKVVKIGAEVVAQGSGKGLRPVHLGNVGSISLSRTIWRWRRMKVPFRSTCGLIVLMAGALVVDPSAATAQAPPLPTSMAAIGDSFTVGFSTGAPDRKSTRLNSSHLRISY